MNAPRLVSLVAATLITVAQWTPFLWLVEPAASEAGPVACASCDEAMPVIVVTAHRHRLSRADTR
jgi:hypothetical protein